MTKPLSTDTILAQASTRRLRPGEVGHLSGEVQALRNRLAEEQAMTARLRARLAPEASASPRVSANAHTLTLDWGSGYQLNIALGLGSSDSARAMQQLLLAIQPRPVAARPPSAEDLRVLAQASKTKPRRVGAPTPAELDALLGDLL